MFSIKKSFADCSKCPLLDTPSCILETNCEDDLSKVDVIFIAENPGKNEVEKEIPLIGRAGQMFRKYFEKFELNKLNYLITNTVLCQTLNPDGTTGNPTQEVIDLCKENCMSVIKLCSPKLIVLMGASPVNAFDIAKSGITKLHGNFVDWEGYKVLILVHPSFVNRKIEMWEPKFAEGLAKIRDFMGLEKIKVNVQTYGKTLNKEGIHRYKIPDKFYTDQYRLVDVQYLRSQKKVLFVFRDRDNKKIYHKENSTYICYQIKDGVENRRIVPYDQLKQVSIAYEDRYRLDYEKTYEGDVRITAKHAMDYYHYNKGDAPKISNNIMFFDIEVDTGKDRVFPKQQQAKYPINMISSIYNGQRITYVIDNKTEPITDKEGVTLKIFNDEKSMMISFIKDFKESDPDFIAGWNAINFDLWYIFNRLPKIGIDTGSFSRFGEFFVDGKKYQCHLPGCYAVDQEFLYRNFTFTKKENYKLGFIAQEELSVTKIDLPLPFNEMYWKMLNKTIEYNIRDADLLEKLEDKLKHINLLNEIRIVCNTSFEATSSFGQIDSIMVSFLKERGLASRNGDPHTPKIKYPGAFVFLPPPGTYDYVVDFDFASLYPSIIITYNLGIENFIMKMVDPHLGYELAYEPDGLPDEIELIYDPTHTSRRVKCTKEELLAKIKDHDLIHTINGCFFKPHKSKVSFFSEVVEGILSTRKDYKNKMFEAIENKDGEKEQYFYTRQLVYKVLANSLYGVIANKAFRFFDVSIASAITLGGQEALKTSIVEADAYMRHLDKDKPYVKPKTVTKLEMFADPDEQPEIYKLPDRSHDYIITGDTDSIFCCFQGFTKKKDVAQIMKWCKSIQNFLNKDIMEVMVKRHNVDTHYNRLVLKNELIISRGLFLTKKRYAIRVINNEGKDVDKINFMGVEVKRSDYPSKSKEFLSELTSLILKSETIKLSKILRFVQFRKREFMQLIAEGDKSIARPVSFGKEIEDYKMLPQAVRAMQAWNEIMYDIHRTGAKSYMFKVSGIDTTKAPQDVVEKYERFISKGNKLDVIAIPDEEPKLPSFFIPDIDKSMKFAFEDRCNLFLEPLMTVLEKDKVLTI